MPFVCEQYAPASAAALLAEIEVMLVAAGWTLHDPWTATKRIYKSNGELGDRIYEYIFMSLIGNVISFYAYGWWDNATHAGNCYTAGEGMTYAAGELRIIGGNKNIFYIYKTNAWGIFGHVPNRIDAKPLATLTAPAVAGTPVVLAVDNVDMFASNTTYQIFSPIGEGRYPVKITVVAPLALTIANLPVNMAAGSMIGASPSLFGLNFQGSTFYITCPVGLSGTGVATTSAALGGFITDLILNPNYRLGQGTGTVGLYVLQPTNVSDTGAPLGYIDSNVLMSPIYTDWTIFGDVNLSNGASYDTGTADNTSGNFTLVCLGKLWGINTYQNKFVAIISGTGAGQTRKIASNTADTLTVGVRWDANPNGTSIFAIFAAVYRVVGASLRCFREVINL